jgi:hypothetical protein
MRRAQRLPLWETSGVRLPHEPWRNQIRLAIKSEASPTSPAHRPVCRPCSLVAMAFETPWRPSLNGKDVQPCECASFLFKYQVIPDPDKPSGLAWSSKELDPILDRHPESKDALAECVVAIWRLREVKDAGGGKVSWVENMLAWLVSLAPCRSWGSAL